MYDYITQISEFIESNFAPSESEEQTNIRFTSHQLLEFLFDTFPEGCITDYELNDLMLKLKYKRTSYTISTEIPQTKKQIEAGEPVEFHHQLHVGWCMISFSLQEKNVD